VRVRALHGGVGGGVCGDINNNGLDGVRSFTSVGVGIGVD